jgi:sulfur-oxidizing protein SoxB
MKQRRDFLKSLGLAGLGITVASPLSAYANIVEQKHAVSNEGLPSKQSNGKQTISILQTTDVHCQVHPHDELFWEDGQIVFP